MLVEIGRGELGIVFRGVGAGGEEGHLHQRQGDQAEDQHPDHGEDIAAQGVHGCLSVGSTAAPTGKGTAMP
ncbi:hypothetical protein H3H54_01445 [Brachybacterium sp. Z12]|uniref:hypothetical protein n=1 Tax=Brachybacterium sp. Z12 TaxID=2759167 RepID=UPI00185FAB54|nr:hypothetical protein [Brachybacterium sp. Z12]QNN82664.1 hypothetical protein H3H54_01445 [Brachybacterium sp. Z12]